MREGGCECLGNGCAISIDLAFDSIENLQGAAVRIVQEVGATVSSILARAKDEGTGRDIVAREGFARRPLLFDTAVESAYRDVKPQSRVEVQAAVDVTTLTAE